MICEAITELANRYEIEGAEVLTGDLDAMEEAP